MAEQSTTQETANPTTLFKSKPKVVYRIPALFYQKDKKILLAFAERRDSKDDAHSVALAMKKGSVTWDETSHLTSIEWSKSTDVITKIQLGGHRPMNPCPVYDKENKKLFLVFITVKETVSEQWQIKYNCNKARLCYVTTSDAGQTWSDVTDLTDGLEEIKGWSTFAVGPGHGLQMEEGRLIVPVYAYKTLSPRPCDCCSCQFPKWCSCFCECIVPCCCSCCKSSPSAPYALSLYSDDKGVTWKFGKMLERESIECQMAEIFKDNNESVIYCNARSKGGMRVEAFSESKGEIFRHNNSGLEETVGGCHGSVVSFPSDSDVKGLLYSHPTDKNKRKDLGIYLNKTPEDPKAWSAPWIIYHGPSGYSDLVYLDRGWFACLFECGTKTYTEQINLKYFSYNDIKPEDKEKEKEKVN